MNDPIPIWANGACHVFFQHNPDGARWGTMHWGHARTTNFGSWEILPVALSPTPSGWDAAGCWTGSVVKHDDRYCAIYTGIPSMVDPDRPRQVQGLATSVDLIAWEKYFPALVEEPPLPIGACFRDPCVFQREGVWWMVVGSEDPRGAGGLALLYHSLDLQRWEFRSVLCRGHQALTGRDFECPDFFELNHQWIFLSSRGYTFWQTGALDEERYAFHPGHWGIMDSAVFYAGKTALAPDGRRILFGWLKERRSASQQRESGWSGVLALPRLLQVSDSGRVLQQPLEELRGLRQRPTAIGALQIVNAPGEQQRWQLIEEMEGPAAEVELEIQADCASFGLYFSSSMPQAIRLDVLINLQQGLLDGRHHLFKQDGTVYLDVFIDHSVVEVFVDRCSVVSGRVTAARIEDHPLSVWVAGGMLSIRQGTVWQIHAG